MVSSVRAGDKQVGAGVLDLDSESSRNVLHAESTVRGKHKLPLKEYALWWGGVAWGGEGVCQDRTLGPVHKSPVYDIEHVIMPIDVFKTER